MNIEEGESLEFRPLDFEEIAECMRAVYHENEIPSKDVMMFYLPFYLQLPGNSKGGGVQLITLGNCNCSNPDCDYCIQYCKRCMDTPGYWIAKCIKRMTKKSRQELMIMVKETFGEKQDAEPGV